MHFSILEILNIVTTQEIPTLTITSSKLALLPLYLCIWWYVWVSHHPQHWSLGWYQTASAGMKQQSVQSADWSTMDSTASSPLFCCGFRYLITLMKLKVILHASPINIILYFFRKKMRFLFYVLLIFSVVSCFLNAIILNLIFGVCCSFLVLLNLLIILFHDLFFHAKIIDLSTKKMSSEKKHKIVFHLTSILLFLHISFTTTSFILASIIFKGKNQFPYFMFY